MAQRSPIDLTSLVVDALAVYRVTRLLTTDRFPPVIAARSAVEDRLAGSRAAAYAHGVTCPHCVSFWVAAAAVAGRVATERRGRRRTWDRMMLPWALSAVAGIIAEREVH